MHGRPPTPMQVIASWRAVMTDGSRTRGPTACEKRDSVQHRLSTEWSRLITGAVLSVAPRAPGRGLMGGFTDVVGARASDADQRFCRVSEPACHRPAACSAGDFERLHAAEVHPNAGAVFDHLGHDVVAVWAAHDDSGALEDVSCADRAGPAAVAARHGRGGHLGGEHLGSMPATALPSSINSSISDTGPSLAKCWNPAQKRYRLLVFGPLPGRPEQLGEFVMIAGSSSTGLDLALSRALARPSSRCTA